jgi:hypothetical protein
VANTLAGLGVPAGIIAVTARIQPADGVKRSRNRRVGVRVR